MKTEASLNEYFAAIVESSDDAIITKNLDSIIQTWNGGAERLFGYTAAEAIGQPITMIIPTDRLHEEDDIIARLRRGERLKHFETVRRRKDGTLVPISATISPVRIAQARSSAPPRSPATSPSRSPPPRSRSCCWPRCATGSGTPLPWRAA